MPHAVRHVHTRAAILSIGDELTLGQTLDTNAQWLSRELLDRGIVPVEHVTVADDAEAIADALLRLARGRTAGSGVDVIVSTGGLGPTADDLTREALASALGERLILDEAALVGVRAWYESKGRPFQEINRVQAMRPHTACALSNPVGTAPGLHAALAHPACDVFCLPGPPKEMQRMFHDHVVPALQPSPDQIVLTRALPTFGLGESEVATRLGDMMDRIANPLVGTTASNGIVTCRLRDTSRVQPGQTREAALAAANARLDATEAEIRGALGPYVLASKPMYLRQVVVDLLRAAGKRLVVAESCTGGLVGAMLTEIPGVSEVFEGGVITYANEQKTALLGVPPDVIARHGAVSHACAVAMAKGALGRFPLAHFALSITGIAGPSGGSDTKPVGTVWIAMACRDGTVDARRFAFSGERDHIRHWAALSTLGLVRLHLIGHPDAPLMRQSEHLTA